MSGDLRVEFGGSLVSDDGRGLKLRQLAQGLGAGQGSLVSDDGRGLKPVVPLLVAALQAKGSLVSDDGRGLKLGVEHVLYRDLAVRSSVMTGVD